MFIYLLWVSIDGGWWLVMASFTPAIMHDADMLFGEGVRGGLAWRRIGTDRRVATLDYRIAGRHYQEVALTRIEIDRVYTGYLLIGLRVRHKGA